MSWQAMDAIDQHPYDICGPLAFRVLVKLANVAANDGTRAWRLNGELAAELGVSVRSVYRALDELEQANLIRRGEQKVLQYWRGGRRPVVWDVVMHTPGAVQQPLPELEEAPESRGDTVIHSPEGQGSGVTPNMTPNMTPGVNQRKREEREEQLSTKTPVDDQTGRVTPAQRTRCSGSRTGRHSFDAQTGWCTNACGLRNDVPAPIGAHA